MAGLGRVKPAAGPEIFDKVYRYADIAVIGGGPGGCARRSQQPKPVRACLLLERHDDLGGHLRYAAHEVESLPAYDYAADLAGQVRAHPDIAVMTHTAAFGHYNHNWIGALQGNRLVKLRAKSLVVAAGAYDIPLSSQATACPA